MASAELIERLSGSWAMAEARSRRYERGSMSPLPPLPERQDSMDRIVEALRFADEHTDREVAAAFPGIVRRAVTDSQWRRIKPPDQPD